MSGHADSVSYRVRQDSYQRLFFEGGSLGRLWKISRDDDKVDEVSVCRSIMVHTNSSYLL